VQARAAATIENDCVAAEFFPRLAFGMEGFFLGFFASLA
jgi:hypothetical protein